MFKNEFLTLKCQGLVNPSNNMALKRLVEEQNPFIIFLQEIVIGEEKILHECSKIPKS